MSEWWTYRLSDFLLFSPRTYHRLFELYNAAVWPAAWIALAMGLVLWRLAGRGEKKAGALLLAAAWCWVGLVFHLRHYATINWAAGGFGAAFVVQAALLAASGWRAEAARRPRGRWHGIAGHGLLGFALLAYPALAPLAGRDWRGAELFGLAPDPTALGTLGWLLLVRPRWALALWLIPVAWCLASAAMLSTMAAPETAVMLGGALLALTAVLLDRRHPPA